MRNILLIIICLSGYISVNAQRIDTLPFTLSKGLLVIPGKINNHDVSFIFDTGAGVTVTTEKGNNGAGISTKKKTTKVRDANHNVSALKQVLLKRVSVGSFSKEQLKGVTFNMPFMECQDLQLLGQDFIHSFHWKFDFENGFVCISDAPFEITTPMSEMDITLQKGRPFTTLNINQQSFNCLIDFGYRGYLDVNKESPGLKDMVAKKIMAGTAVTYFQRPMSLTSIHDGDSVQYLLIDSLILSGQSLQNIPTSFSRYKGVKIGYKFFTSYCKTLIINSSANKYFLEYKQEPDWASPPFDAGFIFENGKIIVSDKNLSPNSSAAHLEIGESIKSLNGKTINDFKDFCGLLKWRFSNNEPEIMVEKEDGKKIMIKRQPVFKTQ
ncbi:MAG: retroviral-like aspartic protease family protein [Chitinophagaceae bacterium]|nr:retroviral-like aspartic protease family protein [Chitinophagaceae bacterium]